LRASRPPFLFSIWSAAQQPLLSFPTRRSSDLSLLAHGSLQPVLARGGHELFTTPHQASVTLERRTLPGESVAAVRHEVQQMLNRDRKSTRLNSSHVKISYAVFCLKKKKLYVAW